jgi:DNA-binding MarR family transcriptional regulator
LRTAGECRSNFEPDYKCHHGAVPPADRPRLVTSTSFLLVALGRTLQARLEAALAERGLTLRHIGALGHLAGRPDLSYSDLARRAGITPQSMRATVRRLETLGAVRRLPGGQGKAASLEVTALGHDLLAWAGTAAAQVDDEFLATTLSPTDVAAVRRAAMALALPPGIPRPPDPAPSPDGPPPDDPASGG